MAAGMPARADDPVTTQSLSDEIYTLKEQAATLQARNQQILAALDQLKTTLQSKLPNAAPTIINTPTAPTGPPDLKAAAAKLTAPDALNLDGMPAEGDAAAPVAVLEYTDFEDSEAGEFARHAFRDVEKNYVKSGKVRYVHEDMTLPWHPNATIAARAARCSGDQGKFWEMRASLFGNQDALGSDSAIARAQKLGEKMDDFKQCILGRGFMTEVIDSVTTGQRFGVSLTPTFFIGSYDKATNSMQIHKTEVGAVSFDTIKADIEAQLTAAH